MFVVGLHALPDRLLPANFSLVVRRSEATASLLVWQPCLGKLCPLNCRDIAVLRWMRVLAQKPGNFDETGFLTTSPSG
jgi:hypothetical protein